MPRIIPRYERKFSFKDQCVFWFGTSYVAQENEFLINLGRSGIIMALKACLPKGGRVGLMSFNCKSVADAIIQSGCKPVYLDVTSDFLLDLESLKKADIEVLVITNLFGFRNNLNSILSVKPNLVTIIDNAHGYGLPKEGDFTIYSINQTKYPSLAEGGILFCNNLRYIKCIKSQYETLPDYTTYQQFRLYFRIIRLTICQKVLYSSSWALKYLQNDSETILLHNSIKVKKMCKGSRNMYHAWLQSTPPEHKSKLPFVDVVRTDCPNKVKEEYLMNGIDVNTMFKRWVLWATNLGYEKGQCPMAEYLSSHTIMIPNYYKNK